LREDRVRLRDLKLEQLIRFCEEPAHCKTKGKRLTVLRQYLVWCSRKDPKNAPDPDKLFPKYMAGTRRILPPVAEEYLAVRAPGWKFGETPFRVRLAMSRLHGWLSARDLQLADLSHERLTEFLAASDELGFHSRQYLHKALGQYLDWLSERGAIQKMELHGLLPIPWYGRKRTISQSGREYLKFLPAVVTAGTSRCHHTGLARFFMFLHKNGLNESSLMRPHLEDWIKSLSDAGLAPSTRGYYIQKVRHYLHWRHDRGELQMEPQRLLSASDIPKRPKLLPRPFPLDIDLEIQRRLRASDQLVHWAILLLRRTGIRTHELCLLPESCVHGDHAGNSFLKVPLGKMNSERLVPLDPETLELIQEIRKRSKAARADGVLDSDNPPLLIHGPRKNRIYYQVLRAAFSSITYGLSTSEPMGLHRLRHTYATELLNAGMSLYGLMQILGHRQVTTTLIYAGVAQQTIHEEYFAAIEKLKDRYAAIKPGQGVIAAEPFTPDALADDLARSLRRMRASADRSSRSTIHRLIRRVDHLRTELKTIL
jgi:site-specific recombinase XerD